MKKVLLPLAVVAFMLSTQSCAKCYTCKNKEDGEFVKTKICDKDFDKSDVQNAIKFYEAAGYTCVSGVKAM